MGRVAVRESVTLAGLPERARVARVFMGGVLGPGHPCEDVVVLLASELFGNSVRHSGSGLPGGTVMVAMKARDGLVRVEVTDRSGTTWPTGTAATALSHCGGDVRRASAARQGATGAAPGCH
jgi:hypothetical protein